MFNFRRLWTLKNEARSYKSVQIVFSVHNSLKLNILTANPWILNLFYTKFVKRRIKLDLNIFLTTLFYEWRKYMSTANWGSRNYQITSYFVPTVMAGTLVSTQDFEFMTKLNEQSSNFEFVKRPVESSLSVCLML